VWGDTDCISNEACLLTVCGRSNAVFDSATIAALKGGGESPLQWRLALCINAQSTVTFRNSMFTSNKDATPMALYDTSSVLLEHSTIKGNTYITQLDGDGWSGGIAVRDASLTVLSSTIEGNVGTGYEAGAILVQGVGQASIQNTTFLNNKAPQGAAVFATHNTTVVIQSSKFEGNIASLRGGAIFANQWSQLQILPSKRGECAYRILPSLVGPYWTLTGQHALLPAVTATVCDAKWS
jgi:predicted outer membrane repeat protein